MDSGQRKRSRWGNSSASNNNPVVPAAVVPDDAAIRALVSEAEARQESREKKLKLHDGDASRTTSRNVSSNKRHDGDRRSDKRSQDDLESYYGPQGQDKNTQPGEDEEVAVDKEKPNFGVSGALAKDTKAGNMYRGVLLKFREPPEARAPNTLWRLYVYKGDDIVETLHINRQSAYLCGRNTDIADIPLLHPSCSSQHAVIQFRAVPDANTGKVNTQPYLMDLESANGTFLNGVPLDSARYYQLKRGDLLKFGCSTREYVLLTANTKKI